MIFKFTWTRRSMDRSRRFVPISKFELGQGFNFYASSGPAWSKSDPVRFEFFVLVRGSIFGRKKSILKNHVTHVIGDNQSGDLKIWFLNNSKNFQKTDSKLFKIESSKIKSSKTNHPKCQLCMVTFFSDDRYFYHLKFIQWYTWLIFRWMPIL